jgi:hypothetical protein
MNVASESNRLGHRTQDQLITSAKLKFPFRVHR